MDLTRREQVVSSLADKTYRDAFVADQIRLGVPLQIKQMRDERGLSQEELGQQMQPPMVQESVWRLENPNKANLTIGTLLRVASAMDVGLTVRFVPFSELIDTTPWIAGRERGVSSFAKDEGLRSPSTAICSVNFGTIWQSTGSTAVNAYLGSRMATITIGEVESTLKILGIPEQKLPTANAANTQLAKVA